MKLYNCIQNAIEQTGERLKTLGRSVQQSNWQSISTELRMWELFGESFKVPMPQDEQGLIIQTRCDVEWCKTHFKERVSGIPLNPGESYKIWPYYGDKEKTDSNHKPQGEFSHTYMERMSPKSAGNFTDKPPIGIRYEYGDFKDVIDQLYKDPYTRQAFLPIWFPEDTGAVHGERVPCTLGYLFNRRGDYFHITYYIRSCDFIRHFRNDMYLTVRLAQYFLEQLKLKSPMEWNDVSLGFLFCHIQSLHVFEQEKFKLK